MKESLEIAGSVANFAGGIVLLIDALRMRGNIQERSGGNIFQKALDDAGVKEQDAPRDSQGDLLATAVARELWLAVGPLKRSWIGCGLLVAGFACEIVSHFFK
jgi:hypothetical protein